MAPPNPHAPGCPWHAYAEQYGAPNLKWCEQTLCAWISEPANTWSNLAYIVVGVAIIFGFRQRRSWAPWFGLTVVIMGVGSFVYHMSNFYLSQVLDFIGMYFYIAFLLYLNLRRLKVATRHGAAWYAAMLLAATATFPLFGLIGIAIQNTVMLLIAMLLVMEGVIFFRKDERTLREYVPFIAGFGLLALAKVFAFLDEWRIWCDPTDHVLQGHALWHLLSAASCYVVCLFYVGQIEQ